VKAAQQGSSQSEIEGILDEKTGLAISQPSIKVDYSVSFFKPALIDENLR